VALVRRFWLVGLRLFLVVGRMGVFPVYGMLSKMSKTPIVIRSLK
jgi:hypothetical protein